MTSPLRGSEASPVSPGDETSRSHAERAVNPSVALALTLGRLSPLSRELMEALPVAIYTTDARGRLTFYNRAAATLWGREPPSGGQVLYCGSWRLFQSDDRPMAPGECPMALALKEARPIRDVELIIERPDGTRVPVIPYPTPLFDAEGQLVGAVNMLVDISDRKRAESSLARSRDEQMALYQFTDRLYRASSLADVCESAMDAIAGALDCKRSSILLFDDAGVMRFMAWRGLSEDYRRAVEGHSPWDRDAKDPQPVCIEDVQRADLSEDLKAVVQREGIGALAFIPLVAKGELVGKFMTYYERPHTFTDSELELAVTIARQLGFSIESTRAEEARLQAEAGSRLLASIIENTADAIISKDLEGTVTTWNRGAEELFGYTAAEMVGKPIKCLLSDPEAAEPKVVASISRGRHIDHVEALARHKDGSLFDISLTLSPMKDASGRIIGASAIARDISQRKQALARQELLTQEMHHRTKNLFALVHSVVRRSFAGKSDVAEAQQAVVSRLRLLAQTHAMLIDNDWKGADLAAVVNAEMGPYAGRVTVEGASVRLSGRAAQNFAMALHELATNATKYGALSAPAGHVHISWRTAAADGTPRFVFCWEERGGPPVTEPERRGFGSAVLEQVMAEYVDAPPQIEFAPDGVRYCLSGPPETLTD